LNENNSRRFAFEHFTLGGSMEIAVIGTGIVGRSVAGAFADRGNQVTVGTRVPEVTMARTDPDFFGNPPYAIWAADHPSVRLATFADAAAGATVVVNATEGAASLAALGETGDTNLAGKVIIDISNALDFSEGYPPSLFVVNTDSLAEQIQQAFPDARVVKALNTITAALMAEPRMLNGGFTGFIAGDDDDAKRTVHELLTSLGHDDIIDLGDLTAARALEMHVQLWLRVYATLGTPIFGFKVVR
jgi:8-hydroxy-5-deazaflavin:NADPH oxidoreductase